MKLTKKNKAKLTAAFKRGKNVLDKLIPYWRERIDWEVYDFWNIYNCIAGQLKLDHDASFGFNVPKDMHKFCHLDIRNENNPWKFLSELWKSERPS